MNNILKNFYCDFILLRLGGLSITEKIIFLFQKYIFFICKLFGNKKVKLLGVGYDSGDGWGLLGIEIMLKDFYSYYYFKNLKSPVIVDVGACVGNFTLASNIFYESSKIYSIEPVKDTYRLLEFNTRKYQNVFNFNIGIGDKNENKTIYYSEAEKDRSSFYKENISKSAVMNTEEINVLTLDTFLNTHNIFKVDILKIDVEGFEKEVIDGLGKKIDIIQHLIIEIHLSKNKNNFAYINSYLAKNGFVLSRFGKFWVNADGDIDIFDVIYKKG